MINLAWAELKYSWKTWIGFGSVVFVTSIVMGVCATLVSTWLSLRAASSSTGALADVLVQLSVMVSSFSGLVAVVVLNSVASSTVQTNRKQYARWQLLGITPGQVRGILALQLAILGLGSGFSGLSFALVFSQPTLLLIKNAVTNATGDVQVIEASNNSIVYATALFVILLIVLLSGLAPARRASRVSVLDALRTPEPPVRAMTATRWTVTGVFGLATVALMATAVGSSREVISLNTIFACITASGMSAALTPLMLPLFIQVWPRLIPDRASVTWAVARRYALHHIHTSAASVAPLMVGITLIGAIFSAAYTERNALLVNGIHVERMNLAIDQIIIMLGGPVILAVVGSAAIVFQGTADRGHSARILSLVGFSKNHVLILALTETIIYVGTALLISLIIIFTLISIETLALSNTVGPAWPTITFGPIAVVTVIGAAITAFASTLPLLARKKQ